MIDKKEVVLEVKNLSIDIPVSQGVLHAVENINLHVGRGEILCVVGESGCGKSLTSLAIMGLLPKNAQRTAETLELNKEDLQELTERQLADIRGNRMAMIFQEPMTSLNPSFTIENQLLEPLLRHKELSKADARNKVIEMLELVGIKPAEPRLRQYPHQLSGGLRQRVMIAMSLLCNPDLIIADEPTTALDVTIQAQILELMMSLQEKFNTGILFITHDMGVVANIADRVAVMYAGQIVEEGPVSEIFNNPAHPYTRGLMGCIPVPGKVGQDNTLGTIPGMVPSVVNDFQSCRFGGRWDENYKENFKPCRLTEVPKKRRSFKVNLNEKHLVHFCCDECLHLSEHTLVEGSS